jgi:rRNA small subunit pseudouridine methyltransferase Nep1
MPLTLILVEAGVELIPKKLRGHPSVKKNLNMRNYTSQLLDNALHHSAMRKLKDYSKRGRPDVAHVCLLNALGSPLNKKGLLRIYLHTVNGKIYEINSNIRIARNFNRFKGLMAKMILDGQIKTKKEILLAEWDASLSELIESFKNREVVVFSKHASRVESFTKVFPRDPQKHYIALVGCFQKTSISDPIKKMGDRHISISEFSLDACVVVSEILTYYSISHDLI